MQPGMRWNEAVMLEEMVPSANFDLLEQLQEALKV
jgi:hypothetical protein